MQGTIKSNWRGSKATADIVREQIRERFGDKEAEKYNPITNCLTFNAWKEYGFQVKKGEKALKSVVIVKKEDDDGVVVASYPRTVNLFYIKQVQKV